jgi:hypothetical protein
MNKKFAIALAVIILVCIVASILLYTFWQGATPPPAPGLGANGPIGGPTTFGPIGASPTPLQ